MSQSMCKNLHTPSSIKDAPGILGRCLEGLHAGSGWTYLVLMGGPHPLSNGEIAVARFNISLLYSSCTPAHIPFSYNAGPEGADFSQSHPDVQKKYMAHFTEYLEKIYRKSESQFGFI